MFELHQSVNAGGEVSCQCCPYGFHIDLDFVRFCESLATGAHLKARREERRTRRLQCNSMEVLLGLTTPTFTLSRVSLIFQIACFQITITHICFPVDSSTLEPIIDREADIPAVNKLSVNNINVDLNRAVDDFEAALSLSSRHSQVSTALSTSTASSTGTKPIIRDRPVSDNELLCVSSPQAEIWRRTIPLRITRAMKPSR